MTDGNKQNAITEALQGQKAATDRHKAAMKTLEDFETVLGRVTASRTKAKPVPVTSASGPTSGRPLNTRRRPPSRGACSHARRLTRRR